MDKILRINVSAPEGSQIKVDPIGDYAGLGRTRHDISGGLQGSAAHCVTL
jgi:hypothetical protein